MVVAEGLNPFKRVTSDNLPATIMLPSNMAQKGGLIGYNSGGFIPHGSRLNDTIPAHLNFFDTQTPLFDTHKKLIIQLLQLL